MKQRVTFERGLGAKVEEIGGETEGDFMDKSNVSCRSRKLGICVASGIVL